MLYFEGEGGAENVYGKVLILLQTHISRGNVRSLSLVLLGTLLFSEIFLATLHEFKQGWK